VILLFHCNEHAKKHDSVWRGFDFSCMGNIFKRAVPVLSPENYEQSWGFAIENADAF